MGMNCGMCSKEEKEMENSTGGKLSWGGHLQPQEFITSCSTQW